MSEQHDQPSPVLFFETVNAFHRTAALKAALELEIFTAIAEGQSSAPAIANRCKGSLRGIEILCNYLVVIGFLSKQEDAYALTRDSQFFLSRTSPAYVGGAVHFLLSPTLRQAFEDLSTAVRTGTTALGGDGLVNPDNPVWVRFAEAMGSMAMGASKQLPPLVAAEGIRPSKVLDIAAGHGLYGIAFAQMHPEARVFAADWPPVLKVAQANAQKAGVTDRYSTIPGNAFESQFGEGYDVVLITNFLHHFNPAVNEDFLRKVHASLRPGGVALTVEFLPNPDRVTPEVPASFSLIMLAATGSGNAYTYAELERMMHNAGFARCRRHDLEMSFQSVVVARKD